MSTGLRHELADETFGTHGFLRHYVRYSAVNMMLSVAMLVIV
jgi:hypothetical protein